MGSCTVGYIFFPVKVRGTFIQMQETPHFSELVESAAKTSDVAASNLKNTQWHADSTLLAFIVSCLQISIKYIVDLKIRLLPGYWPFIFCFSQFHKY